jgi:hypothetical protein
VPTRPKVELLCVCVVLFACTPRGAEQPASKEAPEQVEPEDEHERLIGVYNEHPRWPPVEERDEPPPPSACHFAGDYRVRSHGRVLTFVAPEGRPAIWPELSRVCVWSGQGKLLGSLLSPDLHWVAWDDVYLLSEAGLVPGGKAYWDLDSHCVLRVRSLTGELIETYRFDAIAAERGSLWSCDKQPEYGTATAVSFRRYSQGRTVGIRPYDEWIFRKPEPN